MNTFIGWESLIIKKNSYQFRGSQPKDRNLSFFVRPNSSNNKKIETNRKILDSEKSPAKSHFDFFEASVKLDDGVGVGVGGVNETKLIRNFFPFYTGKVF